VGQKKRCRLEIKLKEDGETAARDVCFLSDYPAEKETMFPVNSTFSVTSCEEGQNEWTGQLIIKLTEK
jgi:hypothetical protein